MRIIGLHMSVQVRNLKEFGWYDMYFRLRAYTCYIEKRFGKTVFRKDGGRCTMKPSESIKRRCINNKKDKE